MSIQANELIVIDTNALIHWVRQDATGHYLLQHFGLEQRIERPLLSTVVEGEIRGLARCWNWGTAKQKRLDEIVSELVRVDAGQPDVVRGYADLYYDDQQGGHNTGENDLWIAATAKATGAVLLTADRDFSWMCPNLIRLELVPMRP